MMLFSARSSSGAGCFSSRPLGRAQVAFLPAGRRLPYSLPVVHRRCSPVRAGNGAGSESDDWERWQGWEDAPRLGNGAGSPWQADVKSLGQSLRGDGVSTGLGTVQVEAMTQAAASSKRQPCPVKGSSHQAALYSSKTRVALAPGLLSRL